MGERFRNSRYGYKEWGNIECFRNTIVCCSTYVIFSIIQWKDYLISINVGMVGRTTLKPYASLCKLFYLFVLELTLSISKLSLAEQLVL